MEQTSQTSLAQRIGNIYLWYLTLLPAVGTVVLIGLLRVQVNPLLVLIVGTAAVGIYLAITGSYTSVTSSPWKNAALLLDGPVWAIVGWALGKSVGEILATDVLIEIGAMLLGLLAASITSPLPTKGQRKASIAIAVTTLAATAYVITLVGQSPLFLLTAFGGIVQGAFTQYRLTQNDHVQRDAFAYILVGIIAWIASLFAGYALYELL